MAARPSTLSHFDADGSAHMVDVGGKDETRRVAIARGRIAMRRATLEQVLAGRAKKGDVLGVARLAAIQGAKRTPELIPLAHPLALTHVSAEFGITRSRPAVICTVTAETVGRTGVEMEALTACAVGLLTVYDMLKAVDRGMRIEIELASKTGGSKGPWSRF